jgi:hypothetical protein
MKLHNDTLEWLRDTYVDRSDPENLRILANVYWQGMVIIASILTLVVFGFGLSNLLRVLNDLSTAPIASPTPVPTVNRAKLEAALGEFEVRTAQFKALKTSVPAVIPDPAR